MRYCKQAMQIHINCIHLLHSVIKINFVLFHLFPHHMNFIIYQVNVNFNCTESNQDCHSIDCLIYIVSHRIHSTTHRWIHPAIFQWAHRDTTAHLLVALAHTAASHHLLIHLTHHWEVGVLTFGGSMHNHNV